tara:strand:- start:6588 stop:7154 length:567 start_codon:yes stop_codon:yes gene_type:complete
MTIFNYKHDKTLRDILYISLNKHSDKRGYLYELYNSKNYRFLKHKFVQQNFTYSKKNVLRGMHFQSYKPRGYLITVIQGKIFDVFVDLRSNSKNYKKYSFITLSSNSNTQIFIPPGFAHGFLTLSDYSIVSYNFTNHFYDKYCKGFIWNDEDIKISWPIKKPILNMRDSLYPQFKHLNKKDFPKGFSK